MKRIIAMLMALVMVLGLAACGGSGESTDPNAGVYEAVSAEMWGFEMAIEEVYTNGFTIELKDGGKCRMTVDGDSANGKWSLVDGVFEAEAGGVEVHGTLADGVMQLEDVMDSGLNMVFVRPGATVTDNSANTAETDDSDDGDDDYELDAYYDIDSVEYQGEVMNYNQLVEAGLAEDTYVAFWSDGVATVSIYGEAANFNWDGTYLTCEGEPTVEPVFDGDYMTIDIGDDMYLTFVQIEVE